MTSPLLDPSCKDILHTMELCIELYELNANWDMFITNMMVLINTLIQCITIISV